MLIETSLLVIAVATLVTAIASGLTAARAGRAAKKLKAISDHLEDKPDLSVRDWEDLSEGHNLKFGEVPPPPEEATIVDLIAYSSCLQRALLACCIEQLERQPETSEENRPRLQRARA